MAQNNNWVADKRFKQVNALARKIFIPGRRMAGTFFGHWISNNFTHNIFTVWSRRLDFAYTQKKSGPYTKATILYYQIIPTNKTSAEKHKKHQQYSLFFKKKKNNHYFSSLFVKNVHGILEEKNSSINCEKLTEIYENYNMKVTSQKSAIECNFQIFVLKSTEILLVLVDWELGSLSFWQVSSTTSWPWDIDV